MIDATSIELQAILFGKYYLKHEPNRRTIDMYTRALTSQYVTLSDRDQIVLSFTLRHPWALPFMDAGLALTNPQAELRRRLFVMFAILEATPEYCNYFLPQRRPWFYGFVVLLSGFRAIIKAAAGITLLRIVR